MRAVALWPSVELPMGPRSAIFGGWNARRREEEGGGGRKGGTRGPSLQNEDPTPQDGWELE
eukprot:4600571-Pyramimonas_sp.AAC.1